MKLNCLATETAGGHKNAREDQDKQKTVTFRAEKEGNRIEKRKFSATVDSTAEESASEDRLIKKPGRTMKRTYSKIQRSPSSNGSPNFQTSPMLLRLANGRIVIRIRRINTRAMTREHECLWHRRIPSLEGKGKGLETTWNAEQALLA